MAGIREENDSLNEKVKQVKAAERENTSKIDLLSKQLACAEKNRGIDLEVAEQQRLNEVESLRRKMSTVEARLQCKIRENKQKDEFIKNNIIGKTQAQDVPQMVQ